MVFLTICLVLATHYAFTLWMFDLCIVDARAALQSGRLKIAPQKRGLNYSLEPAICPGLWDEVKNSRNRAVDILLAWASGGATAAASVPVIKSIVKGKPRPKE